MLLMRIKNIKKEFGEKIVLKDINLDIKINSRIGLVGKNGCGKTTLAKIISGLERMDSGIIDKFNQNIDICYLKQISEIDFESFNSFFKNSDNNDFFKTSSELGLKKVQTWEEDKLKHLSGGEKTKLSLSQVLNRNCDLFILDEPTNHLDLLGIEWLINEIKHKLKPMIIISHDRYFLDQVVEEIAEIEDGKINLYQGNYTTYRNIKNQNYQSQLHQYHNLKRKEREIDEEIDRLKRWSQIAHRDSTKKEGYKEYWRMKAKKKDRQIKSTIKRLEKMKEEGVTKPIAENEMTFEFTNEERLGLRLVLASNLTKQFNQDILFTNSRFYLERGDKVGLIGANGCGKTTLIKMILGLDCDYQGELFVSKGIKAAYLSQDIFDLNEEMTLNQLISSYDKDKQTKIRTYFASNGITSLMLHQKIANLSLGERTRIKIIFLIIEEHNVLILDEPTNHLDLQSLEQLEKTLHEYQGTIILATHDTYLLEQITTKLLVFKNQSIMKMEMGYKEYQKLLKNRVSIDQSQQLEIIQNQITFILSELNKYPSSDRKYHELDQKFKELILKKQQMEKDM